MQDALLQAFDLSKPKNGPTYIWADTGRQRYHDSFSSKHGHAGGKGSGSGDDDARSRRQIPARHSIHGSSPLQQILHGENVPAHARFQMEGRKGNMHPDHDMSNAREIISTSGGDQNPVQLQLCVNDLSSESVGKMLAVHARMERRAQSLIEKVHVLRRACNMLLSALPQHIAGCALP